MKTKIYTEYFAQIFLILFIIAIGVLIGYGLFKDDYEQYLCEINSNFSQYECSRIIGYTEKCSYEDDSIIIKVHNETGRTCFHNWKRRYEIKYLSIKEK